MWAAANISVSLKALILKLAVLSWFASPQSMAIENLLHCEQQHQFKIRFGKDKACLHKASGLVPVSNLLTVYGLYPSGLF